MERIKRFPVEYRKSVPIGLSIALAVAASAVAPIAEARITSIVIDCARSQSPTFCPGQGPTFGSLSFPGVGQYEKLRGTAYGELDPLDPHNSIIVDIELAPRNAAGKVTYSTDIFILKPIHLNQGNHRLLVDVNNRGEMRLGRLNNVELTNDPTTAADAGDGFIMRHGYSVAGNGWDPGATGTPSMKISVPSASYPGTGNTTITGPSYEYIVFDNATTASSTLTYPAATLDKSQATLTRRALLNDTPVVVPASGWTYNADGTRISLVGSNFQQSWIYEFKYIAKNPIVAGIGLAATRDFVSFLRKANAADGNPLAMTTGSSDVQHTFSYSISQPSRYLNDLVGLGFNQDENGRRVLDGILSHTGGGSGVFINYRFAQPGRTERNRQNHLYPEGVFPFAHQMLTDHLSGKTDGRDRLCAASNTCPKRLEVNTANEYWVKAGSLLHTDTHGKDLKDPKDVRYYLISGLSHGVGDVTMKSSCQQFLNPTSPYPAHRALLLALDDWVSKGDEPPKSEVPRRDGMSADAVPHPGSQVGTVPPKDLGWPTIPDVTYTGVITTRYFLDFGPGFENGSLTNYPPSLAGRPSYPIFVSTVDKDGNEEAGVRMPPVEAPIATTTGWALRRDGFGLNDGCEANGQHILLPVTKADREKNGDPRKSLQERYKDHAGYVKAVEKAAKELQKKGFLIAEDVQHYIDEAEASNVLK